MVWEKIWLEVATSSQSFSRTISYTSSFYSHLPAYEDGTDRVFHNIGI